MQSYDTLILQYRSSLFRLNVYIAYKYKAKDWAHVIPTHLKPFSRNKA